MTHIVGDTLSCIPVDEAKKLGIEYFPQIIIFGDESYRDDSEMDSDTFIKRLKASSELPKTSAPYPSLYTELFQGKLAGTDEPILVICPSGKMSGTVRSAITAAKDFPDLDIRVIDTQLIGSGLGSVLRAAASWRDEGLSTDEIEKRVHEMSARNRTYFFVGTLEYLHKGGRIGTAKALVGSMLQTKPILCINNGQVESVTTERTRKKALAKFIEIAVTECPKDDSANVSILRGESLPQVLELAEVLKPKLKVTEILIAYLPPAIMVHAGPDVLGVSFFVNL